MSKEEFAKIAMALQSYYPRYSLLPSREAMELWFMQLNDFTYTELEAAVNAWASTEVFPPSIAELRKKVQYIRNGNEKTWDKGWEELNRAIRRFGMYAEAEALQSLDEITRETTKRLGFKNLCLSENMEADRANFRTIYTRIQERQLQEEALPEAVKRNIELIRKGIQKVAENNNSTQKIEEK